MGKCLLDELGDFRGIWRESQIFQPVPINQYLTTANGDLRWQNKVKICLCW
jgi:hypothetical protein